MKVGFIGLGNVGAKLAGSLLRNVHETEGQLILNGSYNVNFTMDHEVKDLSLFEELGRSLGVPLELSPVCVAIGRGSGGAAVCSSPQPLDSNQRGADPTQAL